MSHAADAFGRQVTLPIIGQKVLRDGYEFAVSAVRPNEDVCIIASIELKGASGIVEVGYYDFQLHPKP